MVLPYKNGWHLLRSRLEAGPGLQGQQQQPPRQAGPGVQGQQQQPEIRGQHQQQQHGIYGQQNQQLQEFHRTHHHDEHPERHGDQLQRHQPQQHRGNLPERSSPLENTGMWHADDDHYYSGEEDIRRPDAYRRPRENVDRRDSRGSLSRDSRLFDRPSVPLRGRAGSYNDECRFHVRRVVFVLFNCPIHKMVRYKQMSYKVESWDITALIHLDQLDSTVCKSSRAHIEMAKAIIHQIPN